MQIGRGAVVVITGDRGLAGAFNVNILRRGFAIADEMQAEGAQEVVFVAVGKKGIGTLRFRGRTVDRSFQGFSINPTYADAQQVADEFKRSKPVIINLQSTDRELSKRLIDFASGLTYALDGGMQRVADKVFLLTPRNVEVSAEERARLLERGDFFNQA